jgi:hypothetical protein
MLMEIFMKVNGKMIKHMGMAHTLMQMELLTSENGKTISNMVRVLRPGLMAQNMKDNILKVRSMAKAP